MSKFSHDQRLVAREANTVAWTTAGKGGTRYLARFNLNDKDQTIKRTYDFYNLPAMSYRARDLWSQTDRGVSSSVEVTLPPHSCIVLDSRPRPAEHPKELPAFCFPSPHYDLLRGKRRFSTDAVQPPTSSYSADGL